MLEIETQDDKNINQIIKKQKDDKLKQTFTWNWTMQLRGRSDDVWKISRWRTRGNVAATWTGRGFRERLWAERCNNRSLTQTAFVSRVVNAVGFGPSPVRSSSNRSLKLVVFAVNLVVVVQRAVLSVRLGFAAIGRNCSWRGNGNIYVPRIFCLLVSPICLIWRRATRFSYIAADICRDRGFRGRLLGTVAYNGVIRRRWRTYARIRVHIKVPFGHRGPTPQTETGNFPR